MAVKDSTHHRAPPNAGQQQDKIVTVEENHWDEVKHNIAQLTAITVLVGIPSDDDQPHKDDAGKAPDSPQAPRQPAPGEPASTIGNATLGYIHENGSPINNVPARPWLAPGVRGSQARWLPYLQQAAAAAINGDEKLMLRAFNAAGTTAVSAVKIGIVNKIPPPLSPRTIAARQRHHPTRTASAPGDFTPLVDTAQFLNSISYVIKRGKT